MPPAWKVMAYLAVVLVLFALPVALGGGAVFSSGDLVVILVVTLVTSVVGYRIGRTVMTTRTEK